MGKFRSFVGACTDDNKRAKYTLVYQQARLWKNLTIVSIAVTAVVFLLVA